ncbi:MAG: histidine kinase, partial [Bacteroidales bacterium]|nr:histidine kinase [Bacteroidales bacterium]
HPEQLMKLPPIVAQKPYLAAIYFADKNSEWTLLPQNSSIILKNKENYLRFDILLACVSAPDKLTFRYRLEGYNDQWTTSHERTYIFQNLPFGKYRLEVQATVNGEDWSESELSPFITISNPFWLTIPGLLLILLGIAGLTLLIVYYTRIIIIRKEEEKLQIEQLKRRAIRAKFIPHFTGNVLNSINYLISKKPQAAQKYISDFSEFTHHTLLNSERLYRTIQEELTYTELYLKLEKLRFEEKLEYEITVDSDIDQKQEVPTMALQTFSENAIKHGLRPKPEGGKITIRVYNQESYIVLSVEDNGIGREKAQTIQTEGTKEGLKIVQQQLDIFNKEKSQKAYLQIIDLYDTKEHPSGTRFELWIPHPSLTINH